MTKFDYFVHNFKHYRSLKKNLLSFYKNRLQALAHQYHNLQLSIAATQTKERTNFEALISITSINSDSKETPDTQLLLHDVHVQIFCLLSSIRKVFSFLQF